MGLDVGLCSMRRTWVIMDSTHMAVLTVNLIFSRTTALSTTFFSNLLSFSAGDQSSPLSESLAELFAVP